MGLEKYDSAIAEYLDNIEQTIKELQAQSNMSDELAKDARQSAERSIRKYLETNEP